MYVLLRSRAKENRIETALTICSGLEPSFTYVRKSLRKTNISDPLIGARTCAYQGVRKVSFSENFAHVLSGCPLANFSKTQFVSLKFHLNWFHFSCV